MSATAVVTKVVTCREMVEKEAERLNAILARRGGWYEDEQVRHQAMTDVLNWMTEEKLTRDLVEQELEKAEADAEEEARLNDPNRETKELFASYRQKLKKEGKMR